MSQRSNHVPLAVPTLSAIALRVPSSIGKEPRLSIVIGDERKAHELILRYGNENVGRVATYALDELREERSFWRGTLIGQATSLESLANILVKGARESGDEQKLIEGIAAARFNLVQANAMRRLAGKDVGVEVPLFNAYPELDCLERVKLRVAYATCIEHGFEQGTDSLFLASIVEAMNAGVEVTAEHKVYLWSLGYGLTPANTDPT